MTIGADFNVAGPATSDYSTVTESPGTRVSAEAVDMVVTRYAFAAQYCKGRTVLEVACGPGPGLGMLSSAARRLVAGDYTARLLRQAAIQYGSRVPLVRLDATTLPFRPSSFDVVLLFEAIYFLPDFETFLECCRSVLTPGGHLLVVTVNPEWNAFNPSPFATRYWSANELSDVFRAHGLPAEINGGFPTAEEGVRDRVMGAAKRWAVRRGLMPKTMKGKELLKRLAFGHLVPFPAEVTPGNGTYRPPALLTPGTSAAAFKVLYAVAHKEDK